MQFAELLSQSWCDLLFANRNKEYGAYQLRRRAGVRYQRAVVLVVCALLMVGVSPLVVEGLVWLKVIDAAKEMQEEHTLDRLRPFKGHRLVEVATGRRPRKSTSSKAPVGSPEIVDAPREATTDLPLGPDVVEMGNKEQVNVEPAPALLKDTLAPMQKDPIIPVKVVEEMPQFPGGPARLMQWLDANIPYPERLIQQKKEGEAVAVFIVNKDGQVSDVRLTKRIHPEVDRAIVTALKKMPPWTPGRRGGATTEVQVTIPIEFHAR